jgi:hypothetical protein
VGSRWRLSRRPTRYCPRFARATGVREIAGEDLQTTLSRVLSDRASLLVLDNFEHVLAAGPLVSEILLNCSGPKALVTSRAALRVSGEHELPVLPLALPAVSGRVEVTASDRLLERQVDAQAAARAYAEALMLCREAGAAGDLPLCLEGLAAAALHLARPDVAARPKQLKQRASPRHFWDSSRRIVPRRDSRRFVVQQQRLGACLDLRVRMELAT